MSNSVSAHETRQQPKQSGVTDGNLALEISFIASSEFDSLSEREIVTVDEEDVYDESSGGSTNSVPTPTPLLNSQGEMRLFRKFNFLKHKANQLQLELRSNRSKQSSPKDVANLLDEADSVRAMIVESNTRLVISIARKFSNSRTEFEELVSEGNIILVNAVDKFDYSRRFRFSTYATHAVQRHFYRLIQRKQRRKNIEIATPSEMLSDVVPNKEQDQPLDHKVAEFLIDHFNDCLDEREAVILRERFGINEEQTASTLKAVAEKVGLSKERVRQLQISAIEKLQDLAIRLKVRLEPSF